MFSGKKVALKQGLNQAQAQQYQEKMRSLGVICELEAQASQSSRSSATSAPTTKPAPTASKIQNTAKATGAEINTTNADSTDLKPLKLADIDKAFSGTIPKVELPNSYKAGVVAVGITI